MTQDLTPEAVAEMLKRLRDFYPHEHELEVVDEAADMLEALAAKLAEVTAERDALKATYEDIYADAMSDAESDAQDFESNLWKCIRSLLDELDFDWSGDAQFDGVTADDAVQFLREVLNGETSRAKAAETKLTHTITAWGKDALRVEELEAEVARLRRTVDAAAKLGRIVGFLGDDEGRIAAFLECCGPELINRAIAALQPKETDHE
jgi:hypothetical protein